MSGFRISGALVCGGLLLFACAARSLAAQELTGPLYSPVSTEASSDLVRLQKLLLASHWAEAAKLAEALTKSLPANPEPFYALGLARWRMGNPIESIRALRSAEKLGLNTDALHKLLGMAYYRVHQYGLFRLEMNRAIEVSPQDYEPYYFLGLHYISDVSNLGAALKFLNEAVARKPDNMKSIYYRGYCEEMLNRHGEAQADYARAIALLEASHDRFSLPYQGMASLLLRSNPVLAAHYAQEAVDLNPRLDTNHFTLSKAEEQLGQLSKAAAELQIAAKLNPTVSSYHYVLSRLYLRMHKSALAQSELRMFEKLSRVYGTGQ